MYVCLFLQLLEKYLIMLSTAQMFSTGMAGAGLELEIVQSAIRVLLSCVASDNKDVSHNLPHPYTALTLGPHHFEVLELAL